MATVAQISTWISEAETARHDLMTGQRVVDVWRDGRRMRFAEVDEVDSYLRTLRAELTEAQVAAGVTPTRRRRAISIAWRN